MASISYTLGANVENLTLTGSGAINGTGNTLDNILIGNSGANKLIGDAGNDTLDGMAGADNLTGGAGADIFVFKTGYGKDIVTDFAAGAAGTDVLDLALGSSFDTVAEVLAAAAQVGANTVITIDATTTLTLQNVQKAALVADDFKFSA